MASKPAFDFGTLMQQLGPVIAKLTGVNVATAGLTSPVAATTVNKKPPSEARRALEPAEVGSETETIAKPPFVAANPTAHLISIQAQLTADERAFVDGVIKKLSIADLMQWRDQLAHMTVDEAVALIRAEIQNQKEKAS